MPAVALAPLPAPAVAARPAPLRAVGTDRGCLLPAPQTSARRTSAPQTSAARRPAPRTSASGRELLSSLAAGDEGAWRDTVRRYESLLRSRARAVLRHDSDIDEAVQRTWVLLLHNADRIADAERLPGWLATTARREALALVRRCRREVPSADVADAVPAEDTDLAAELMGAELLAALDRAIDTLPTTQQVLVRTMLRGEASYDELSRELAMPRGSIGPIRGRAVRALRAQLAPAFA